MVTGRTRDGSVFPLTVRFIASAAVENTSPLQSCDKVTESCDKVAESCDKIADSCDVVAGSGDSTPLPEVTQRNQPHSPPAAERESNEGKDDPLGASTGSHVDFFVTGKVIVYSSLSGMVSLLPDGTIHGCNHHFALMLFGYTQQELVKKVCQLDYCNIITELLTSAVSS